LFAGGNWSPAAYDIRSAATCGAECEFDFHNEQFSMSQARAAVAEVKENQKYWYGDFYPLTPASVAADQWIAYQFHRADVNAGIVLAFRRSEAPSSYLPVKLGGVDPAVDYVVEFINESRQKAEEIISGHELATKLALLVPYKRSSLLVRYRLAQEQSQ
jgi:alpha-galactosidase